MIVGIRLRFPSGTVAEFTYTEGCAGTPEEWVTMRLSEDPKGKFTIERFESEIPLNRTTWPDGSVTDYLKEERGRASTA